MCPVLFKIGPLPVHGYGVMLAVAVLVGFLVAEREAKRQGIDPDFFFNLTIVLVVGGILGSRLAYVLLEWRHYVLHPGAILRIWDGGLSYYGGVLAGILSVFFFGRKEGLGFDKVADVAALGLAAGYPFARIGCFLNGCCLGMPTNLPWAVVFPFDGIPRHPAQLYSSLLGVLIFLVLWQLFRHKRFSGQIAWLYLVLYASYRFGIEFLRVSPSAGFPTIGHVVSFLVGVTALVVLLVKWRHYLKESGVRHEGK